MILNIGAGASRRSMADQTSPIRSGPFAGGSVRVRAARPNVIAQRQRRPERRFGPGPAAVFVATLAQLRVFGPENKAWTTGLHRCYRVTLTEFCQCCTRDARGSWLT